MKKGISVLLSIVLCFVFTALMILWSTKSFLSPKIISKQVEKVDIKKIVEETPESATYYNTLDTFGVTRAKADLLWQSDLMKEASSIVATNSAEYLINGKETSLLTLDEWDSLVDKHAEQALSEMKPDLTSSQKGTITRILKAEGTQVIARIPSVDTITTSVQPELLTTVRFVLSDTVKMILIGICAFITAILLALHYKKGKWILYIFIPVLLGAVLIFCFSFVLTGFLNLALEGEASTVESIVSTVASAYRMELIIKSLILLGLSVLAFILYPFLKGKKENTKKIQI
ncbi:MAG: hypothetical protein PHN72_00115 [Bacilli bacterium]|nr:hypothetical protein [Bacilli bacterium]